jgi:hypothetical protein
MDLTNGIVYRHVMVVDLIVHIRKNNGDPQDVGIG